MAKEGNTDPPKVSPRALQNAATVATLLRTSDAREPSLPKKEKRPTGGTAGRLTRRGESLPCGKMARQRIVPSQGAFAPREPDSPAGGELMKLLTGCATALTAVVVLAFAPPARAGDTMRLGVGSL